MTDADAHYSKIFDKLDRTHALGLGSRSPSPQRSRQENTNQPDESRQGHTDRTTRLNIQITTADNTFTPSFKRNSDDDDN
jgi:hypothetical protein